MQRKLRDRYMFKRIVDRHGWLIIGENQRRIQAIKDKRAAKEERERYEKMAEKMHRKRVERLKRREKRNKLLKS